jgi:hypothetical protein
MAMNAGPSTPFAANPEKKESAIDLEKQSEAGLSLLSMTASWAFVHGCAPE